MYIYIYVCTVRCQLIYIYIYNIQYVSIIFIYFIQIFHDFYSLSSLGPKEPWPRKTSAAECPSELRRISKHLGDASHAMSRILGDRIIYEIFGMQFRYLGLYFMIDSGDPNIYGDVHWEYGIGIQFFLYTGNI